jgi:hypothetical protein
LEDTGGQLTVDESVSGTEGYPAPSSILSLNVHASSTTETWTWAVAYPIGEDFEFEYDPVEFGPAVSIDFQLDVLPTAVSGTSDVDITLAILQGEPFIASRAGGSPSVDGTETGWIHLAQTGLRAEDFEAVDGGPERPDLSQPIQFGYAFTGEYSTTGLSVELGIDNMEATIHTVPEPSSIVMVLAMGAAVLWHRWWSNDDKT